MYSAFNYFPNGRTDDRRSRLLLHVLFCFLVLAILANGIHFWLQKSQILPVAHLIERMAETIDAAEYRSVRPGSSMPVSALEPFYAIPAEWRFTKLLKDFFCAALIAVSLLLWRRSSIAASGSTVALAALGFTVAIAGMNSAQSFGLWVALIGARPFVYLVAGLAGFWSVRHRSFELLSRYLVVVLLIELALGLYEQVHGLYLFTSARSGNRIVGTFSFPTSLGVFAVIACVFAGSFSTIRRPLLLILASVLAYLTGSATALILLVVSAALWVMMSVPVRWHAAARIASLSVIAALMLLMPKIVERHDVMDSLWSRVEVVADYANHLPGTFDILFGKGLGIGSNAFNSVLMQSDAMAEPEGVDLYHARADSMLMALVNQIGVVGTLLCYLLIAIAAWRDREASAIYLILFLASMTINLLELFPINFMLGLLLGRSLLFPKDDIRQAQDV